MTPAESYLADLYAVRGTGTSETSGYPALANLLNAVGTSLKPKITAVIHPSNSGAGLPDGGFFSAMELRKHPDEVSLFQLKPERGVLEVKPVDHDLLKLAQTPQVRDYLEHYGQILLTNYHGFALYAWEAGQPVAGESFHIAESVSAFWDIARHSDLQKGFVVLPRRWVVERTFGWLGNFRRLSKDYEFRTDSSEAFIFLAASLLLIARLT